MRVSRAGIGIVVAALAVASAASAQHNKAGDRKLQRMPEAEIKAARARLNGPEVAAAEAAAKKLGQASNRSAVVALVDGLERGLPPRVSLAALRSLAPRGDARSLEVLGLYARHRRPDHRVAALEALANLRDRRSEPVIVRALSDKVLAVRKAAAEAVARRKIRAGIKPLLALLDRGDAAAAPALAAVGNADIARKVAERIGEAPDKVLAECLGDMLLRDDFGPDAIRVEVVNALAKIPDDVVIEKLTTYIANTPEKPPRPSRAEAERVVGERL